MKPENILIFEKSPGNYILKLYNFGKSLDLNKNSENKILTSPPFDYTAPEELFDLNSSSSSYLIDSWALGVIIYQLCTDGKHPFSIEDKSKDQVNEIFKNTKVDYKHQFLR